MPESWTSRKMRWAFWVFPSYLGTGATVTYIDATFQELRVKIPLNWRTRNYVNTIYGGSMYGAVDPMYMLMLMNILGRDYVVWDKAAAIRFRKPGQSTLYATFIITDEQIVEIKKLVTETGHIDYHFKLNLVDIEGIAHAEIEKTIYIASKEYYRSRRRNKK